MMQKDYQAIEERFMQNNRFRQHLGIQIADVKEGRATLRLPVEEHLLQSSRIVHGGVLAILIDSVIGTAVRTLLPEGTTSSTVEMNINYLRPAEQGTLYSEGTVIHRGKTLMVGTAEIKDEGGRLLAAGRATYFVKGKT